MVRILLILSLVIMISENLNFYEKTCNEEWHTYAFYGLEGRDYEEIDGQKLLPITER